MSDLINRNDPRTQLAPVLTVRPMSTFFRDHFMGGADEYFPTENVEWDKVIEGAPLARFVGDDLTVEASERAGFQTDEIKTPLMQERRIISAKDINRRRPGENIFAPMTDAQRQAELHADDLKFCLNSIDNRIEVMVSQFITTGRIPIVGVGVNRVIDYMIPNKTVLTGGDRWGQTGVSIIDSIRGYVDAMSGLGYTIDEVIMSPEVWKVVYSDETIQKLLDIRRYELGEIAPESPSKYGAARRVGFLADPYVTLYVQNSEYGGTSNRQRHLPAGMVLFVSGDARRNKLGYGAYTYMDEEEQWQTVSGRYIQQFFKERRPPREEILVTSRAVPIPFNAESWYVLQAI
ncbi:MAG: major capsid protein [Clostridiales bacterium]|jgi:hypothetical protein|nr:major capsid protein [Clostridiales bacterium]